MGSTFKPLEKVWIIVDNTAYPGIFLEENNAMCSVLKFDTILWRNVSVDKTVLRHRKDSFSDYMFAARQRFLKSFKYTSPALL